MSFKNGDTDCTFRCWLIGLGIGLLAFLLLWLATSANFFGSLFWGVILAVISGLLLSYLLCRGQGDDAATEPYDSNATGHGAGYAAAGAAAAAGASASASREDSGESSFASDHDSGTAAPSAAREDSGDTSFASGADDVATEAAEATTGVSAAREDSGDTSFDDAATGGAPEAVTPDREDSGNASFAAGGAAAGAAAAASYAEGDYDRDGVVEGADEGTKPATLSAARDGGPDDLKKIKGVGPKLEQLLHSLGFYHFDQVASWSADEVAWVDANLKGFKGRVSRDNWVEQAKLLASGGETAFSKKVDKGDVY